MVNIFSSKVIETDGMLNPNGPDIQHFSIWCFANRFDEMPCAASQIRSFYGGQIIHAGTVEPFGSHGRNLWFNEYGFIDLQTSQETETYPQGGDREGRYFQRLPQPG